jgi:regulator of protease activity HflC (stomatin/prohibitin superfamily)
MNIASFISSFTFFFWIVFFGVVGFVFFSSWRNRPIKNSRNLIIFGLVIALVLSVLSYGLVFINPQDRGVVISALAPGGYRTEPLQPGLHFIVPFAESVVTYPISRQTYTMSIATNEGAVQGDDSITARTSDGQEIFVDASVIFAIDPALVTQVHIQWQDRYGEDLVRPQARGIIRDGVSQFTVEEVYSTERATLVENINNDMRLSLEDNGLILIDFVLRNITFSEAYSQSVEEKQIAEQQAQQAQYTVEQRRQEAEQARQVAQGVADSYVIEAQGEADARIIQAEAESQALQMIADVIQGHPELLTYQYITRLAPNVQVMYLPSGSPFLFSLPENLTATPQ